MPRARRCKGKTKAGRRCKRRESLDNDRQLCRQHAAQSAQVKKEASPARPGSVEAQAQATATAKDLFIDAYRQTGNVTAACEHVANTTATTVGRRTHYDWLTSDADYVERFADAKAEAADRLVGEARRRATRGVEEPVYYQGAEVGHIRRYSDTLLIFLIKGALPETYRERHQVTHDGAVDNVHVYIPDHGRNSDSDSDRTIH